MCECNAKVFCTKKENTSNTQLKYTECREIAQGFHSITIKAFLPFEKIALHRGRTQAKKSGLQFTFIPCHMKHIRTDIWVFF